MGNITTESSRLNNVLELFKSGHLSQGETLLLIRIIITQ